jgi:hypothetical protein
MVHVNLRWIDNLTSFPIVPVFESNHSIMLSALVIVS